MKAASPGRPKTLAGQTGYALLFCGLVPLFLLWLANKVQVALPAYCSPVCGLALASLGVVCMAAGMARLIRQGRGLPMNAFPPEKLVLDGIYGLLPHPIYLGFVLCCLGCSLLAASAAGLWLITPLAAGACAALVWGYERPFLLRQHGQLARPWLGYTESNTLWRRTGMMAAIMLPWLLIFYGFKFLGAPPDAVSAQLPGEAAWPVLVWTYPIYASAYLFVPLAFIIAPLGQAQKLFRRGWVSLALMSLLYLCIPLVSPVRSLIPESRLGELLLLEMRGAYPYTAAFPSYHVVWSVLAASAIGARGKAWAASAWLLAMLISLSCVTTAMHAFIDVPAGLLLGAILCNQERLWRILLEQAGKIANSFQERRIRGWRILSHAGYSWLAGFLAVLLPALLLGPKWLGAIFGALILGLIGAGLLGQLLESSDSLRRPFGYFGGLIGLAAVLGILLFCGLKVWPLAAALCCAAPWVQAAGRLRCLAQGCCHGREVEETGPDVHGLRVFNASSRVVGLSGLGGRSIYPTQLYSILGNLALGLLLLRLWQLGARASAVCAAYCLAAGLLRFIEEGYRGERQTITCAGLPVYQWLAVGMLLGGACLLAVPSPLLKLHGAPVTHELILICLAAALAGVMAALALSVDRPESSRRFSRLSG